MQEKLCKYWQGTLSEKETIKLFVELINTNEIWRVEPFRPYLEQAAFYVGEGFIKIENGHAYLNQG